MAEFVTRPTGYDLSLAGPYRNTSVTMQLHVLQADLPSLWATLQRYLNGRNAGRFIPLGNRVLVSCTDVGEGRAGDPALGSMHEVEVTFFIPALQWRGLLHPPRIVTFAPYLFVNNVWAMVMGREVHGFRKDVATSFSNAGDVDGPGWQQHPRGIDHVETWAMRAAGQGSRLERMKVLEIRHPQDPKPAKDGFDDLIATLIGTGIGGLAAALADNVLVQQITAGGAKLVADLLEGLMAGLTVTVPMAFLRQYRNPRSTRNADVQEVVTARALGTLHGTPSRLRPSEFMLHHAASHPIAQELGLVNEDWMQAELSLEASLDFDLEDAE